MHVQCLASNYKQLGKILRSLVYLCQKMNGCKIGFQNIFIKYFFIYLSSFVLVGL
jgi:hypothetical protein